MQLHERNGIDVFFNPQSVAVFGSIKSEFALGYKLIQNMLDFGYKGRIYPVNPTGGEVHGLKVYKDVCDIADSVDLAIVIIPSSAVPAIIGLCANNGVKGAVVISDSFAELDEDGAKLQDQLIEIAQRTGIRIMGPNTIGQVNSANGFLTIPFIIGYDKVREGNIAYCGQTGFIAPQNQPLSERAFHIGKICDMGNKCDVNEVDMLNYLADDPETSVVAMHLEGVEDGCGFMSIARQFVARKPLIILKSGRYETSAKVSASHSASTIGEDHVYDTAFKQIGAIRVNNWQEYWEIPKMLSQQPLPKGNRIGIVSFSGGLAVSSVDVAEDNGLELAEFSETTLNKLTDISPRLAGNPIDLGSVMASSADPFGVQEGSIRIMLEDENVDCALITVCINDMDIFIQIQAEMYERLKECISKPVSIFIHGTKLNMMFKLSQALEDLGYPTYFDPDIAIKALAAAVDYSAIKQDLEAKAVILH